MKNQCDNDLYLNGFESLNQVFKTLSYNKGINAESICQKVGERWESTIRARLKKLMDMGAVEAKKSPTHKARVVYFKTIDEISLDLYLSTCKRPQNVGRKPSESALPCGRIIDPDVVAAIHKAQGKLNPYHLQSQEKLKIEKSKKQNAWVGGSTLA